MYQTNDLTSLENKEVEPVQPVQINIYQSNTYKKDLSWLHFDDKPRVQERQQVKDQQSCISVFAVYPTIPSSNKEHQPKRGLTGPQLLEGVAGKNLKYLMT